MQFNLNTAELFTDDSRLIKQLDCPLKVSWDELPAGSSDGVSRNCSRCHHPVMNTSLFDDEQLITMVEKQPDICLMVDLNQPNLTVITNAVLEPNHK